MIRKALSKVLPREAKNYIRSRQNLWFRTIVVWHWKRKGCPVPPPHQVKQMVIEEYQKRYGCSVLVETGTYLGDMVVAQENNFERTISIELDQHLYERAKRKFGKKSNITIYQGDSSKVLPQIMPIPSMKMRYSGSMDTAPKVLQQKGIKKPRYTRSWRLLFRIALMTIFS